MVTVNTGIYLFPWCRLASLQKHGDEDWRKRAQVQTPDILLATRSVQDNKGPSSVEDTGINLK